MTPREILIAVAMVVGPVAMLLIALIVMGVTLEPLEEMR